ncbi:hypothetical protein [Arthrobacter sp. UM1]|uniref:hypothetical protein n=1 Tax=Arthrobacter sp. UM1 TaxID=2766776 RepID=UPI001CF711B6|nr:hypothetical protein [Arthrobacter sp. UM1]MCB4209192.1 hypothetical protein [Arthrobacter sp. UM1]
MARERYTAVATREGKWWIVDVPSMEERTQARSLAEVEEMARDLIALVLDTDAHSFDLDLTVQTPRSVKQRLGEAAELEHSAQRVQAEAAEVRRAAIRSLREDYGLSAVDIARSLGMSRGRVYQLLEERPRSSRVA